MKLTASQVLDTWRPIRLVFYGHSSAWLVLLSICEAGSAGILRREIEVNKAIRHCGIFRRWEKAGLVICEKDKGRRGKPSLRLYATPKSFKLLRITPPDDMADRGAVSGDGLTPPAPLVLAAAASANAGTANPHQARGGHPLAAKANPDHRHSSARQASARQASASTAPQSAATSSSGSAGNAGSASTKRPGRPRSKPLSQTRLAIKYKAKLAAWAQQQKNRRADQRAAAKAGRA